MADTYPRVAIVVPRYGTTVIGGAETLARGLAEATLQLGWHIEVWTSCSRDPYQWLDDFPCGTDIINGVTVRRFPVRQGDSSRFTSLAVRLQSYFDLPDSDSYAWLESGPQSPHLYQYVRTNANNLDAIICLPYLSPISYYAAWSSLEKAILWPCLHNEIFAFIEPFRLLAESAYGIIFNSPEEADLALNKLAWRPRAKAVVGAGVNLIDLDERKPGAVKNQLLYVGRLEHAKNLRQFYDFIERYHEEDPTFECTLIGKGPFLPPNSPPFNLLGYVSEEEKSRILRSSIALCQPSENESFSLAIMESWLAGRPVMVSRNCDVTMGHVKRSSGGLFYDTYGEFAMAINWLKNNPRLAGKMGANGRSYVSGNYTWNLVASRLDRAVRKWNRSSSANLGKT